jgi:ribosomal protein L35
MKSHKLEKKSQKRKRAFGNDQPVHESNVKQVLKLLGRK